MRQRLNYELFQRLAKTLQMGRSVPFRCLDHSNCVKESQFLRKKYTLGAGFCGFL